jgi:predicted anti-sigma-YlaC factor YlaD
MAGVENCEMVHRELTNYMEGQVDPRLRAQIEEHMRGCQNCKNLLVTTQKMLQIVGNENAFLKGLDRAEKESCSPSTSEENGASRDADKGPKP